MAIASSLNRRFFKSIFVRKLCHLSVKRITITSVITLLLLVLSLLYIKALYIQSIILEPWSSHNTRNKHVSVVQLISLWTSSLKRRYLLRKELLSDENQQEYGWTEHSYPYQQNTLESKNASYFKSDEYFHNAFRIWIASQNASKYFQGSFILNHPDTCSNDGKQISLLITVISTASHAAYRTAIRETWGGHAKKRGAKLIFFIGIPVNDKYHTRLAAEDMQFHDVVQGNFLDVYANLSLKTMSVLKWVTKYCPLVNYVLKVDDDMFINTEKFINISHYRNLSMTITGELAHKWPPVRNKKNKWFTSYERYPFDRYPDFVFGPSYLLTGDSVRILFDTGRKVKLFHLEDVYVTGFIAEICGIKRINEAGMFNIARDLQPCSYKNLLSSHGHTPPDIYRHWMWLKRRNFSCHSSLE